MADSEKVSSLPSERERFEEWVDSPSKSHAAPGYCNPTVDAMWQAWTAASAGQQELLQAAKAVAFSNGFDAALPDKMDALRAAIRNIQGA